MSFSNMALIAFYDKCGVTMEDAQAVAGVSLDQFIPLQAAARQRGAAQKAKGIAAKLIAENIIEKGTSRSSALWQTATSVQSAQRVLDLLRSASLCRVAVAGYAFNESNWQDTSSTYSLCLREAEVVLNILGTNFDFEKSRLAFERDAEHQSIRSIALGRNTGFFTKIFG